MNEAPMIEDGIPAPKLRKHQRRMTPELRALQPGQSVLLGPETAMCLRRFGYRSGWEMVVRKAETASGSNGVMWRLWRVS